MLTEIEMEMDSFVYKSSYSKREDRAKIKISPDDTVGTKVMDKSILTRTESKLKQKIAGTSENT